MTFKFIFLSVAIAMALVVIVFVFHVNRPQVEVQQPSADFVRAAGKCANCHRRETAAVVHQFEKSMHAKQGVSCLDCHQAVENQQERIHNGLQLPSI